MPDPLRDELSEEAKAALARQFAELEGRYSTDFHARWRVYERLRNVAMNRVQAEEDEWWDDDEEEPGSRRIG